jgi:hypothetical protein
MGRAMLMATITAMIMRKSEGRRWGVIAGASAAVAATAALVGIYAVEAGAVRIVTQGRPGDLLLKAPNAPAATSVGPSRATIKRAIQADPLNQNIFNTAMMQIGGRGGTMPPPPAWFATLGRYGWRGRLALQNLIYYHATRSEIGRVLDVADALFRREKLTELATTVFSLAETDPTLRSSVVRRLQARPAWRRPFLLGSGMLADPAAIEGRYQTIRALQRSGPLPDEEMTALLPTLVRAGRTEDAFALWSYRRRGISRPLNDPQFSQAARTINQDDTATPFNWRFMSGENFDVTSSGRGATGIVINWNGQGVPIFASQQTTGAAGSYRLRIAFDPETIVGTKSLGFRMMCADRRIDFISVATPDATHTDWRTVQRVPCAFPRLEIFGVPGDGRRDITATVNGMGLRRDDS